MWQWFRVKLRGADASLQYLNQESSWEHSWFSIFLLYHSGRWPPTGINVNFRGKSYSLRPDPISKSLIFIAHCLKNIWFWIRSQIKEGISSIKMSPGGHLINWAFKATKVLWTLLLIHLSVQVTYCELYEIIFDTLKLAWVTCIWGSKWWVLKDRKGGKNKHWNIPMNVLSMEKSHQKEVNYLTEK